MLETTTASQPNHGLRGTLVGRYLVLQRLEGREGSTYEALDLEHDRKVTLQLLRWERGRDVDRLRFQREAQALSELRHLNIAGLLDVGTLGDHMWIAEELVRGRTLWEWLRSPHDWHDVVGIMREAGEGLAAAHRFGAVHGTFDPLEIIVGHDGCVCVGGFSNALLHGVPGMRQSLALKSPSYAAPEVITRGRCSAQADQYAFCVTLWEALYGELPFEPGPRPKLLIDIIEGTRRSPPASSTVPRWLRAACEQGLAVDPAGRWPSMDVLLDALD